MIISAWPNTSLTFYIKERKKKTTSLTCITTSLPYPDPDVTKFDSISLWAMSQLESIIIDQLLQKCIVICFMASVALYTEAGQAR